MEKGKVWSEYGAPESAPRFRLQQPFDLIMNCFRNVTILIRTFIIYYYYHLLPQAPQNTSFELLTTVYVCTCTVHTDTVHTYMYILTF